MGIASPYVWGAWCHGSTQAGGGGLGLPFSKGIGVHLYLEMYLKVKFYAIRSSSQLTRKYYKSLVMGDFPKQTGSEGTWPYNTPKNHLCIPNDSSLPEGRRKVIQKQGENWRHGSEGRGSLRRAQPQPHISRGPGLFGWTAGWSEVWPWWSWRVGVHAAASRGGEHMETNRELHSFSAKSSWALSQALSRILFIWAFITDISASKLDITWQEWIRTLA
jgi:hypothetical protein